MSKKRKYDRYARPVVQTDPELPSLASILGEAIDAQRDYEENLHQRLRSLERRNADLENRLLTLENLNVFERVRNEGSRRRG